LAIHLADLTFRGQHRQDVDFADLTIDRCNFDNCSIRDSRISRIHAHGNKCWSCDFHNIVIEDSVIDGLAATIESGGGKRMPIYIWGGRFKHLVLRGRIGSLLLNQPYDWVHRKPWPKEGLDEHRTYYKDIDWALDISNAAFTSVPSLRFAPPVDLIRTNPAHQAVVTRRAASSDSWRDLDIGVWSVVIEGMLRNPWPDGVVLAAAMGGREIDKELSGLKVLQEAGIAERWGG